VGTASIAALLNWWNCTLVYGTIIPDVPGQTPKLNLGSGL
jgi:hypothetical protein